MRSTGIDGRIAAVKRPDVPVHVDDGTGVRIAFFDIFLGDGRWIHPRTASARIRDEIVPGDRLPVGGGDLGMREGQHGRRRSNCPGYPEPKTSREAEYRRQNSSMPAVDEVAGGLKIKCGYFSTRGQA